MVDHESQARETPVEVGLLWYPMLNEQRFCISISQHTLHELCAKVLLHFIFLPSFLATTIDISNTRSAFVVSNSVTVSSNYHGLL